MDSPEGNRAAVREAFTAALVLARASVQRSEVREVEAALKKQ